MTNTVILAYDTWDITLPKFFDDSYSASQYLDDSLQRYINLHPELKQALKLTTNKGLFPDITPFVKVIKDVTIAEALNYIREHTKEKA